MVVQLDDLSMTNLSIYDKNGGGATKRDVKTDEEAYRLVNEMKSQSGISIKNFDANTDTFLLRSVSNVTAENGGNIFDGTDYIWFEDLGERGVDYIIVRSEEVYNLADINGAMHNYHSYTYQLIPEPSTFAALFGALALGLAVLRNKKRK